MSKGTCPVKYGKPPVPMTCFDEIVKVKVGPEEHVFGVHRGLLCHYSDVFRTAFDGPWKEAQSGLIELDEEAEDVFGAFWGWLYNSGALPSRPLDDGYTYELAQDCYDLLSRLWLFADFRNIHILKDQVVNEIIEVWIWGLGADCFPESDVVNGVYENTIDGSPLRELLRDMLAYYQHMLDVIDPEVEDHQHFCSEFMRDVAVALAKNTQSKKRRARSEKQWEGIDRCQYHVHPALVTDSGFEDSGLTL